MEIYTIGFTKKAAEQFFELLKEHGIKRLVDVRLNNSSQLAGFTKQTDLNYFLREICGADYVHEPLLAPTPDLFDAYKKHGGSWEDYERGFILLMQERSIESTIDRTLFTVPTVLLCSEPTADRCHRRLVAEYLQKQWGGIQIIHL